MRPVGYLTKYEAGLVGERGAYYDYVMAGNGVFIEAEGPVLAARVPVAQCQIRGLSPAEPKLVLRHGLIPAHLFELALTTMQVDMTKEKYVAVTWDNGYHLVVPEQVTGAASVKFEPVPNTVLGLHSHGRMRAFFSGIDDHDEQGFGLFGVVGTVAGYEDPAKASTHEETMEIIGGNQLALKLRAGVYGNFWPVDWKEVFEGEPSSEYFIFDRDAQEALLEAAADEIEEEEPRFDELQGEQSPSAKHQRDHGSWMWWNWRFRGRRSVPAPGR